MKRKLQDYFDAGVRLVWYVYPEIETVAVYTGPDDYIVRSGAEVLDGGSILPGFRLAVQEWFERAGELGE